MHAYTDVCSRYRSEGRKNPASYGDVVVVVVLEPRLRRN